jgi:hypothetical protein
MTDPESIAMTGPQSTGCRIGPALNLIGGSGMTRGKINFCNFAAAWFAGMIIVNYCIELIQ